MRISIQFMLLAAVVMVVWGANEALASYSYSSTIGSYWELSDKSSTLTQKSSYLDRYVEALEKSNLDGTSNAIWLKTPSNSFDQNMIALKSLQDRMHEIQNMDEKSFAYQTAIQQITQQEQGEAGALTGTFEGCWFLKYHPLFWGWIDLYIWLSMAGTAIVAGGIRLIDV